MNEEIKAGIYIFDRKTKLIEFDKKHLTNGMKFIQLYFNDKPYIRAEKMGHQNLLSTVLKDFGINYELMDIEGDRIPSHTGENYKVVGAGKILGMEESINFFGQSADYSNSIFESFKVLGTNREHLEEVFGIENVSEDRRNRDMFPSYFVKID